MHPFLGHFNGLFPPNTCEKQVSFYFGGPSKKINWSEWIMTMFLVQSTTRRSQRHFYPQFPSLVFVINTVRLMCIWVILKIFILSSCKCSGLWFSSLNGTSHNIDKILRSFSSEKSISMKIYTITIKILGGFHFQCLFFILWSYRYRFRVPSVGFNEPLDEGLQLIICYLGSQQWFCDHVIQQSTSQNKLSHIWTLRVHLSRINS